MEKTLLTSNALFLNGTGSAVTCAPEELTAEQLMKLYLESCPDSARAPFHLPLGMDYATVSPVAVDMKRVSTLLISGRNKQEQNQYVSCLVRMLRTTYPGQIELYILDSVDQSLKADAEMPDVKGYSFLTDAGSMYVTEIEAELQNRYEAIAGGNTRVLDDTSLLVLIINNPDACEYLSTNKAVMTSLKNVLSKYRDLNVCLIVSQLPNAAIGYSSPELFKIAAEKKQLLWLGDLQSLKIWTIQASFLRDSKSLQRKATDILSATVNAAE